MAGELVAAYNALDALVATITGFNAEPTEPPTDYTSFPFYVLDPDSSTFRKGGAGEVWGFHTFSIQLHLGLPSTVTPKDKSASLPYIDLLKDKLLADANNSLSNTTKGIVANGDTQVTATYGLIGYRLIPTIGWEVTATYKLDSVWNSGAYAKG